MNPDRISEVGSELCAIQNTVFRLVEIINFELSESQLRTPEQWDDNSRNQILEQAARAVEDSGGDNADYHAQRVRSLMR